MSHGISGVTCSQVAKRCCQILRVHEEMLRIALLEQVDLQKRFLRCPTSSVYGAAKPKSRPVILQGLGILEGIPELLAVSGS